MPNDAVPRGRSHTPGRFPGPWREAVKGTILLCAAMLLLAACNREKSGSFEGRENTGHIATLADGGSLETLADVERVGALIDAKNNSTALDDDGAEEVADSVEVKETSDDRRIEEGEHGFGPSKSRSASPPLGRYPPSGQTNIDCGDLGYAVRVDGADPYSLDSDDDGIGCESYLGHAIPDSARI